MSKAIELAVCPSFFIGFLRQLCSPNPQDGEFSPWVRLQHTLIAPCLLLLIPISAGFAFECLLRSIGYIDSIKHQITHQKSKITMWLFESHADPWTLVQRTYRIVSHHRLYWSIYQIKTAFGLGSLCFFAIYLWKGISPVVNCCSADPDECSLCFIWTMRDQVKLHLEVPVQGIRSSIEVPEKGWLALQSYKFSKGYAVLCHAWGDV